MTTSSSPRRAGRMPVLAKYDVIEELGFGGMATVFRAHDKRLGRDVAIKVLHPHLRASTEIAHRFSVEAKAVAKLRHPNIVEVFDVSSEDEEDQYLVVELVRGFTLRKLLAQRGALPPEIGAAIVLELLSGVAHAHAGGVVHRDIKPENVLIEHRVRPETLATTTPTPISRTSSTRDVTASSSSPGERIAVKLTDFGIAKLLDAQGVTSTGQVLGSPAHMAPEQIEGGEVDGRADIFGLGVLMYECFVGQLPFVGSNPAQVLRRVLDGVYVSAEHARPIVGKVWSALIDRALARKPDERFPDALAMRDALAAELERLGMGRAREELEAWLDDPEAWTAAHEPTLIERLRMLGGEAHRSSNAVAAAADYNRALAYAPNDPVLLKAVSGMKRSAARVRLVQRIAPIVLVAPLLASGAYLVTRAFHAPAAAGPAPRALDTVPRVTPRTSSTVSNEPARRSPTFTTDAQPEPSAAHATQPAATAPAKPIARTLAFSTLSPPFGVQLSIDGAPPVEVDRTRPIVLDDKAHVLTFTCRNDLCTPQTMTAPAGTNNVDVAVELAVPPATLVVEGDPSHSYGLTEVPSVNVTGGGEVEVPMTKGARAVHVFDRTDPTVPALVVTLSPGKRVTATFHR